jgi:excisionase family DNA binding protein
LEKTPADLVGGAVGAGVSVLRRMMKGRIEVIKTDAMFKHTPDMMSVPEAGKELRIGKNRAYELIREGRLEAIRVGRKLIVPKSALYEFCRDERNYLLILPNWRK